MPIDYKTKDNFSLGQWIQRMKRIYSKKDKNYAELSKIQINRLDAIGMRWDSKYDSDWECHYKSAKAYYEKYGHLNMPMKYKTENGFELGQWVYRQRLAYNKPNNRKSVANLYEERKSKLDEIGMVWDKTAEVEMVWRENYKALKAYYESVGSLVAPKYSDENEEKYKQWLYRQRKNIRNLN